MIHKWNKTLFEYLIIKEIIETIVLTLIFTNWKEVKNCIKIKNVKDELLNGYTFQNQKYKKINFAKTSMNFQLILFETVLAIRLIASGFNQMLISSITEKEWK